MGKEIEFDWEQERINGLEWMRNRAKMWKQRKIENGTWFDAHEEAYSIHIGFIETEIEEIMMKEDEM